MGPAHLVASGAGGGLLLALAVAATALAIAGLGLALSSLSLSITLLDRAGHVADDSSGLAALLAVTVGRAVVAAALSGCTTADEGALSRSDILLW